MSPKPRDARARQRATPRQCARGFARRVSAWLRECAPAEPSAVLALADVRDVARLAALRSRDAPTRLLELHERSGDAAVRAACRVVYQSWWRNGLCTLSNVESGGWLSARALVGTSAEADAVGVCKRCESMEADIGPRVVLFTARVDDDDEARRASVDTSLFSVAYADGVPARVAQKVACGLVLLACRALACRHAEARLRANAVAPSLVLDALRVCFDADALRASLREAVHAPLESLVSALVDATSVRSVDVGVCVRGTRDALACLYGEETPSWELRDGTHLRQVEGGRRFGRWLALLSAAAPRPDAKPEASEPDVEALARRLRALPVSTVLRALRDAEGTAPAGEDARTRSVRRALSHFLRRSSRAAVLLRMLQDRLHRLSAHTLTCPITMHRFVDPVLAADGHTYERAAIERWFAQRDSSPMTGERVPHKRLCANRTARLATEEVAQALGGQPSPSTERPS